MVQTRERIHTGQNFQDSQENDVTHERLSPSLLFHPDTTKESQISKKRKENKNTIEYKTNKTNKQNKTNLINL